MEALLQSEQVREPRLDESALFRIEQVLVQRRGELRPGGGRLLVLGDQAAHSHHVGKRPVGDAFAVGETAAAVPPDRVDDAVEVLVELPRQARLADAGDAGDRDELGAPVVRRGVEEVLDQLQLALAADERRLQAGRLERTRAAGDDPQSPEERHGLGLALELVQAGFLVRDRLLGRALRRLADQDVPGSAADWMRDAVLTRSPATMPSPSAPIVTAASPVSTPPLAWSAGSSSGTEATRSSAARTARSASSSVATGVPQTAMTASPMNFSTVPP